MSQRLTPPTAAVLAAVEAEVAAGPVSGREVARRLASVATRDQVRAALDELRERGEVICSGLGRGAVWALPDVAIERPPRAIDEAIREAHSRGLTTAAIVAELGAPAGTVRARMSALGLRAHRTPSRAAP